MKFDNPDAVIRISMELDDHCEQSSSQSVSELGWVGGRHASIGWCVGVHVADALQRLLGDDHRLEEAYSAVIDCIEGHRQHMQKQGEAS